MSHDATNWAIQVRGLKPAAKIVLWHLADFYNPENGCFPSQERLAYDCEMSRAALNVQLKILEDFGIISRKKRFNEYTKQQKSTFYTLHFHITRVQNLDTAPVSRNEPIPCPDLHESRVQNLDTNPVIEPVIEPVMPEAAPPPEDLDVILYREGKALLGRNQGGQITKLKSLMGVGNALQAIRIAKGKENATEYIAGIIHNETAGKRSQSTRTIEAAAKIADAIIAEREATGIHY